MCRFPCPSTPRASLADRLVRPSKWGRSRQFPGKVLSNRGLELARADLDLDFERFEIRGQGHILLDGLEVAERKRQLRSGTSQQLAHGVTGRAVGSQSSERDLYQAGRQALVPHRLDECKRQLELARPRGRRDLETVDAKTLNAVGRGNDAAIERQV